jgi:hypothetical protein
MPRKPNIPKGSPYWKEEWKKMQANGEDKKQLERAKARRMVDKAGINRKGKDVGHIKPVEDGGKSVMSNLRIEDSSKNQSNNLHKKGEK